MITVDDERLYKLKPLPDVPFCGALTSRALQRTYETERQQYRAEHPHRLGNEEAKCPMRVVTDKGPHRWGREGNTLTSCVFCGIKHGPK